MDNLKGLKARIDLAAVIKAHGVPLKAKGRNLVAPCPFHREKTPSFTVDPARQLWKCFGCGAGGDVITFLEKRETLSRAAAIRKVRTLAGSTRVTAAASPASSSVAPTVDALPQILGDRVLTLWQNALAEMPQAQEYLKGRGLWVPEILRTFHVGFSSGRLSSMASRDDPNRALLKDFGILNDRGNEFFFRRLVVPLTDASGLVVNVYGRALSPDVATKHLYRSGPRRGVFNFASIRQASTVILTESVLDALSLIMLGFPHTTASFGADGFSAQHITTLLEAKTRRVYCAYDADDAGNVGAESVARELVSHGIEVLRVALPVKDPNDFLRDGGTREGFQKLLDAARPLGAPRSIAGGSDTPAKPAPPAPAAGDTPASPRPAIELVRDDRTYRLIEEPVRGSGSVKVVLQAIRGSRQHVESFNLFSGPARAAFIGRLVTAFLGQVQRARLEEDFFHVFNEIHTYLEKQDTTSVATPPPDVMTDADRAAGLAFLGCLDLIVTILADITNLGIVGEDNNKLLAYLVATSRKLDRPLSLSVISRASAGKSYLLNRIADLMPPEELLRYTRMSPRALFYDEPGRYKHKILFIEEAIGAKDADLGVRSMQSERRLACLATMTDPKTGLLKTQETVVEGPLTYLTSSVDPLDYETATRSFEIAIDESAEQTARVVTQLFRERTFAGLRERRSCEVILRRHRNAQRLLERLVVVNNLADQLTFPSGTLRLRREVGKYLSLIEVIALLHQHQRPIRTETDEAGTFRYVEVIPSDVNLANRLMVECLARALSDLPGPAQQLLLKIRDYVTAEAETKRMDVEGVTFSRRTIREFVKCSDHQLDGYLNQLVRLEYIEVVAGSQGKRYVYTLSPDHRLLVEAGLSTEEKIVALGLTPASQLKVLS